jgi:hypothetical protein
MNYICHIIGITQNMKDHFLNIINEEFNNITIIDLDVLSSSIINDETMNKLYYKYSYYSKKNLDNNKSKNIEKKMETYWKNKMEWLLAKQIDSKFTIIIGKNTYNRNSRIYINLQCCKFIIKVDLIENAKQIIKYNLEKYKDDIIDGIFNLKYLEIDFIIKNRKDLEKLYIKKGYSLKHTNDIINFLKININNNNNNDKLYIASTKKFDKKIYPDDNNELIAYNLSYLAIIAIYNNKYFESGFDNNEFFIKETIKNGFKIFNNGCYLYIIDKNDFMYYGSDLNKLFIQTYVKYIERKLIPNIIDFLYNENINMITYK